MLNLIRICYIRVTGNKENTDEVLQVISGYGKRKRYSMPL